MSGSCSETILPKKDIEESFGAEGAEAYFPVSDGEIAGGLVLVLTGGGKHGHLDLLYVKSGCQGKGIGQAIWKSVEALHPETEVWETHAPYFEKRNIHFYVNRLGFHIVEFYNKYYKDPHQGGEPAGRMPVETGYDFFRLEKDMRRPGGVA